MILVIDNVDSFVFNLARYVEELGAETCVRRNDAIDPDGVAALNPRAIILSPGPCGPAEAGQSLAILKTFGFRLPILGVCLGHQCIAAAFGGHVGRAREPMHGRASAIDHDGTGLFAGLPNPLQAGRYHSLIVTLDPGGPLRATAHSPAGEVMALTYPGTAIHGVQFHPESILTPQGRAMLANFLRIVEDHSPP